MVKRNEPNQCTVLVVAGDDVEIVGHYPIGNTTIVCRLLRDAIGDAADNPLPDQAAMLLTGGFQIERRRLRSWLRLRRHWRRQI